jgi:hypothetical protein
LPPQGRWHLLCRTQSATLMVAVQNTIIWILFKTGNEEAKWWNMSPHVAMFWLTVYSTVSSSKVTTVPTSMKIC